MDTCNTCIQSKRRDKLRKEFTDYLGGCCSKCGYDKCVDALDFHHLDGNDKDYLVSQMQYSTYSKERIIKEMEKCVILCSNCHRDLHFREKEINKLASSFNG